MDNRFNFTVTVNFDSNNNRAVADTLMRIGLTETAAILNKVDKAIEKGLESFRDIVAAEMACEPARSCTMSMIHTAKGKPKASFSIILDR